MKTLLSFIAIVTIVVLMCAGTAIAIVYGVHAIEATIDGKPMPNLPLDEDR